MKGDHVGEFEELVLLAIHGLRDGAYGVAIQQLLERETTRRVTLGAVYACLDRLESKELVHSEMSAGTAARGGRSRRMFRLSPEGARTLTALRAVRDRLYGSKPVRGRA